MRSPSIHRHAHKARWAAHPEHLGLSPLKPRLLTATTNTRCMDMLVLLSQPHSCCFDRAAQKEPDTTVVTGKRALSYNVLQKQDINSLLRHEWIFSFLLPRWTSHHSSCFYQGRWKASKGYPLAQSLFPLEITRGNALPKHVAGPNYNPINIQASYSLEPGFGS